MSGGLVAALLFAEVALRLLPNATVPVDDRVTALRGLHEPRPDRAWLYGLRPGVEREFGTRKPVRYTVNADGFRDRRYARPKPPGVFRVVVLGDSVAFGYGVPEADTFPKQLEAALRARAPGVHAEVLNLGVNGYNPYNEARLFADVGVGYEPDLVLVQFCANDLNDPTLHFDANTELALGELPDAAFPDPARRRPPPSLAVRACGALRTCTLVADFARGAPRGRPSAEELRAAFEQRDGRGPELAWLRARYDEIARTAAALGARFAVILFPDARQLTADASPLEERLVALGREAGWVVVDLLPAFRRAARQAGAPLFLDGDPWHPTGEGNRAAAEAILAALACRGLVPVAPPPGCTNE